MDNGKILFLSHGNRDAFNDVGNGYIREFVKNGARYLDYDDLYLERGYSGFQRFLEDYIREHGIEVLVLAADVTSFHFPLEFFRKLRPGVFTVTMAGDTVYYYEVRDKYYAGATDLFVVYDSFDSIDAFRAAGGEAIFFWLNYDRSKYYRSESPEKPIDVSFIGGMAGRKERAEFLGYLKDNGVDVQVLGGGTPGGQVSLERMVEIFNQSKINLNFTDATVPTRLTRNTGVQPGRKQMKGRLSELAICGTFILSEYAKDIEKVLVPGKEIALFTTKEELLAQVRRYLAADGERRAIAEGAFQRAIKDYDVGLSIPRLMREIARRKEAGIRSAADIPADAVFDRNFGSFRILCLIRFLKRLKLSFALEEFILLIQTGKADLHQVYDFFMEEVVDKFPRAKRFLKRVLRK